MKVYEPAKKKGGHWGIRTRKEIKDIQQREEILQHL